MKIGKKIRELRLEKGLTLGELSKRSGIALATLSRIENEKMTGTLESHWRICKALGISLPRLYSGLDVDEKAIEIQKEHRKSEVSLYNKNFSSEILATRISKKKMMPVLIKLQPNAVLDVESEKLGTEKFIYIIEGSVEIAIDNNNYRLLKGDSIYFDASLPHQLKNASDSETKCLTISSPPIL